MHVHANADTHTVQERVVLDRCARDGMAVGLSMSHVRCRVFGISMSAGVIACAAVAHWLRTAWVGFVVQLEALSTSLLSVPIEWRRREVRKPKGVCKSAGCRGWLAGVEPVYTVEYPVDYPVFNAKQQAGGGGGEEEGLPASDLGAS